MHRGLHSSGPAMTSEGSETLCTLAFRWLLLLSVITLVTPMAIERDDWSGWSEPQDRQRMYQACGSQLDDLVALVCEGNYNSKFDDKRSTASVLNRELLRHVVTERVRQKRQNIVDECCRNTCSYETLQLYCASR